MGQVAGAITSIKPAREIVDEMMVDAARVMRANAAAVTMSKL